MGMIPCMRDESASFSLIPLIGQLLEAAVYSNCNTGGLAIAGAISGTFQLAGVAMLAFAIAIPTMRVVRYEAAGVALELRPNGLALSF